MNSIADEYYDLANKIYLCRMEIMRMLEEVRDIGEILQSIDKKLLRLNEFNRKKLKNGEFLSQVMNVGMWMF